MQAGVGSLGVIAALVLLLLAAALDDARGGLQAYMQTRPLVKLLLFRITVAQSVPLEALQVGLVKFVIRLNERGSAKELSYRHHAAERAVKTYSLLVGLVHGV